MFSHLFDLLQAGLQKGFPILFSFLDDALLLGLSQLGINLPWLHWLGGALLGMTLIYWSWRLIHVVYRLSRVN